MKRNHTPSCAFFVPLGAATASASVFVEPRQVYVELRYHVHY